MRSLQDEYRVFCKLGGLAPAGCVIRQISAISIGKDFGLSEGCKLLCQDPQNGSQLTIGNNVKLNYNVMLISDCGGVIHIKDNVLIGPNVVVRASNHNAEDVSVPTIQQGHVAGKVIIEDNVWIGANCVILPDVTIGHGAIIAAGSIVNRSVEPNTVVGGVPAKKIKDR